MLLEEEKTLTNKEILKEFILFHYYSPLQNQFFILKKSIFSKGDVKNKIQ